MIDKFTRPLCVYDLETTSNKPATARIVQIAVRKIMPDGTVEDRKMLINPQCPIPAEATDVHKITDEMVANAPKFHQIAKGLLAFIDDSDLAGYNIKKFDNIILVEEFLRAGIDFRIFERNIIDAYNIFTKKEPRDLTAALKFFCNSTIVNAHDAMADVEATQAVLFAQVDRYEEMDAMTMSDLDTFSSHADRRLVDVAGCFYIDADEDACFAFGKHKDKKCKTQAGYLQWMMTAIDNDTKEPLYALSTKNAIERMLGVIHKKSGNLFNQ